MKIKLGLTILISLILCVAYCFPEPTNYTATMVMMGMESPYAKDGKKVRMEMNMGQQGMGKMVSLIRGDLQKSYMLNPDKKTYFENDTQKQNRKRMPSIYEANPDYKIDKVKVGSDTIDKHPCIKSTITVTNIKSGEKYTGTVWEATDLQSLPIRNEMVMGNGTKVVYELKNAKINAANPEMFEIPAGYKKVDSMMQLMGMGDMGNMSGMRRPKANNSGE
jgi:hypothetical protein